MLRCTRCGAVGPLVIDPSDPTHLEILRAIRPGNGSSGAQLEPAARR